MCEKRDDDDVSYERFHFDKAVTRGVLRRAAGDATKGHCRSNGSEQSEREREEREIERTAAALAKHRREQIGRHALVNVADCRMRRQVRGETPMQDDDDATVKRARHLLGRLLIRRARLVVEGRLEV